jgi:TPR repeat protein
MLKRILAGLIVAVTMASGAVAGAFEDGFAAVQTGDYATALKLWTPLADKGDADAQNAVGPYSTMGATACRGTTRRR